MEAHKIPEPLVAMYSACEAVGRGEVREIELEWTNSILGEVADHDITFRITVRSEVKPFTPPDDDLDAG